MVSGILIITVSAVLVCFWFRYSCLRLLQGRATSESPFSMRELRARLRSEGHLDAVHQSLERDYRIMAYLLEHGGARRGSLEERLLIWDYKAMKGWYRLTRTKAPRQAARALLEMASIIGILAAQLAHTAGIHTR
jgi:hypothetical protein